MKMLLGWLLGAGVLLSLSVPLISWASTRRTAPSGIRVAVTAGLLALATVLAITGLYWGATGHAPFDTEETYLAVIPAGMNLAVAGWLILAAVLSFRRTPSATNSRPLSPAGQLAARVVIALGALLTALSGACTVVGLGVFGPFTILGIPAIVAGVLLLLRGKAAAGRGEP